MLQIKRTGAEDYGRFIKALIFGDPGSGKTLISSTFPNPLYASAEGGLMSIADKNIPYVDVKSSDDLMAIKNSLSQPPEVRAEILGFPVDTIVVDTLDEIQKIMIAERLVATRNTAMQLQDWGWLSEQMRAIIRAFRNMPINVVFTCHIKETSDDAQKVWHKPDLQGSLADAVTQYVDLALLIAVNTVAEEQDGKLVKVEKRQLVTVPSARYPMLKDRSGKLPRTIDVNFVDDYARIHELIFANVSLPETVSFNVETPGEEPEPEIVAAPTVKEEKPAAETTPPAVKVKEEAPKAAKPEVPAEINGVKVRNPLPDGVVPNPQGFDTGLFCVECGDEVESEDRAKLARIRTRKILDDKCYQTAIAKGKE